MDCLSLKIKLQVPEVLGKIDLSKIDTTRKLKRINKAMALRDKLDSGWGWTFRQIVKNYKRTT